MARASNEREWLQRQREKEKVMRARLADRQREHRGGLVGPAMLGAALGGASAPGKRLAGGAAARASGGMVGRGLAGLGGLVGKVPVIGGMATKAAGIIGGGAAATGGLALGAAAALAAKAAVKMTNAQIRMAEEFVKARKVFQIGGAYSQGLQPTALGRAQATLATARAAGGAETARGIETYYTRQAERFASSPGGAAARGFKEGLGANPKAIWENIKRGGRFLSTKIGGVEPVPNYLGPKVSGLDRAARDMSYFTEDIDTRKKRLLLESRFPMLKHEFARGTAMEGMSPRAGGLAIATPANPMHRELLAKIDQAIDAISRLGRLP